MFEDRFENMILEYEQALSEHRVFAGLMKDLFPGEEMEANLLILSYDLGIVSALQGVTEIDSTFAFRYISRLQKEYGIGKENAEWAISAWCVYYGKNILHKECSITSRPRRKNEEAESKHASQIRCREKPQLNYSGFGGEDILPVTIGTDADGTEVVQDFADIPHYLVCGHSGTGKTCFVQTIMTKLAIDYSPSQVKYLVYDSKSTDYIHFDHMPHMYGSVITNGQKFAGTLAWAVVETMKRYRAFAENNVKDLEDYNQRCSEALPHVFIIIDDLYGLFFRTDDEILDNIKYILVNGRQAGMHFIIVTSTPSSKVLQKDLLANISGRICFAVSSKADSRTVLNSNGAEALSVPGEIIFKTQNRAIRCWAAYMSEDVMVDTIEALQYDYPESYSSQVGDTENRYSPSQEPERESSLAGYDEMLPEAVEVALEMGACSVSMLQRRIKLGYSRASRIVDQMEELGIVGPYEGAKPRSVIIDKAGWSNLSARLGYTQKPSEDEGYNSPEDGDEFDVHEHDSNEEDKSPVMLRPFHATTVKGGSFFIVGNEIHMTKQKTTKIGDTPVRLYFDGNAIEGILYKKPRLFGNGYFQFTFDDTMGINNNRPELIDVDVENASDLARIEFERENASVVLSFLEQVAEDCDIEITYI